MVRVEDVEKMEIISPVALARNKSPITTSTTSRGRVKRPWLQNKNEGFFKNSPKDDIIIAKKPGEGKIVSPSMNEFLRNENNVDDQIDIKVAKMPENIE